MTDVLVVGGGLAAIAAALEAAAAGASVLVASGGSGSSELAQGGVAAAVGPGDSLELHEADTLSAGSGLSDPATVRVLVSEAAGAVAWLQAQGVEFDRGPDGLPALALEAAHSRPRVLHAGGDGSGAAILSALRSAVTEECARRHLRWVDDAWLESLLKAGDRVVGGRFRVAGRRVDVRAAATVLATGGYAGLFAHSTTFAACHGAGLIAAVRAGAELGDLEFVQFHPTAYAGPHTRFLLTEALRGAGAHLIDSEGRRFLFATDPRGELAPRSTVTRAIAQHLRQTGHHHVYLDAAPIGEEALRAGFPAFTARCHRLGIDPLRETVPVAPAAHYTMGGIVADVWGRTRAPGLLAAGECARTGAHGANRLASNSLLEAVVCGRLAGRTAAADATRMAEACVGLNRDGEACLAAPRGDACVAHRNGLRLEDVRRLLTQSAGPLRSPGRMADGLSRLNADRGSDADAEVARQLACLVLNAALARQESRGAHVRDDRPDESRGWQSLEVAVRGGAAGEPVIEVRPRIGVSAAEPAVSAH